MIIQTINLYRYTRLDGGITVSPTKPDGADYIINYRLIADEGKILTDGSDTTACIDTESQEEWRETIDEDF